MTLEKTEFLEGLYDTEKKRIVFPLIRSAIRKILAEYDLGSCITDDRIDEVLRTCGGDKHRGFFKTLTAIEFDELSKSLPNTDVILNTRLVRGLYESGRVVL